MSSGLQNSLGGQVSHGWAAEIGQKRSFDRLPSISITEGDFEILGLT